MISMNLYKFWKICITLICRFVISAQENSFLLKNHALINQYAVKLLLQLQDTYFGFKAAEEEIMATLAIENIDLNRSSVRKILKGMAPDKDEENRILGIKHAFEFIANTENKITKGNLCKLYMMTVGAFLQGDDKLLDNNFYRHDSVYIISDHIEHSGLEHIKISEFMNSLIAFANMGDNINDLVKAAIIHFYIAFVHPYFDGNGRMARLVHLWFLIQKGYHSALFIPFSSNIEQSRKAYYDTFTLVEENRKIGGKIDVTPFILYFIDNVYNKINSVCASSDTLASYDSALKCGKITPKEALLWKFVLSSYATEEFSTKQLEKDFGDAAYATIRAFVLKFEDLNLLASTKYGQRTRYKVVK